ncbi:hypothetical protein ACJX0J_001911 (mitochondrion) [Zea mays]
MSRAPTVYPLFYYFPPLILESAHNCWSICSRLIDFEIVGLKLLPKVSLKIEIFFGLDAQIDGIAANSIFIPFISIPLNLIHLEGGKRRRRAALGLTELGCGISQRIDGASLQNRFRPNEFKAVLYGEMKINALFGEQQHAFFENPKAHIYHIFFAFDRCIIRWFGNQKTFLKSLAERLIQAPYKAGKLYAVSATKRRLENRFHLLYPLLGMKNMLLSQFIGIKLFNVGEKQKKQLLYSKFIILLVCF